MVFEIFALSRRPLQIGGFNTKKFCKIFKNYLSVVFVISFDDFCRGSYCIMLSFLTVKVLSVYAMQNLN